MKKKLLSIKIENPCQQDWNKMPRKDNGLYCGDCKKVVHDFALLSDEEIIRILTQKRSGEICGVFRNDQLNRDLFLPVEKHFSFRPVKILLLSLFTLKFILPAKAAPDFKPAINYFEQKNYTKIPNRISGKATDILTGQPIQNITISIVGFALSTNTDSTGHFYLILPDSIRGEKFTLHAATPDYWIADTTISRAQFSSVINLRMTKVLEIVSIRQNENVYSGRVEPYIIGGTNPQVGGDIYVKMTFWQKLKRKFRRKI